MTHQRPDALPDGYELDRYRIERMLGEGGFGITYLGRHLSMGDTVAIKEYLPLEFAMRESGSRVQARGSKAAETYRWGLDRFLREAKILANFREHPNIVSVRDYFEANGTAYLVMQYERGLTFDRWLEANPQPSQEQLLDIATPLLDGLRAVHEQSYLHRDIKPGNIYIRQDGRPLLIDFGASRQALGERSRSLTSIITPGYSPKEQYSSTATQGPWSDLYALAATLWRAVSGREPPLAGDRGEARDEGQPDPLEAAARLGAGRYTEGFLRAIDGALAYLPKDRPQTVKAFQDQLLRESRWQSPAPPPAPEPAVRVGPPPQSPQPPVNPAQPSTPSTGAGLWAGLVAAMVLLVIGGYWLGQAGPTTGMEFVRIEGGEFLMGSPSGEEGRADDEKQHRVSVAGFYMGKYEVTNGQYRRFKPGHDSGTGFNDDNQPVVKVDWNDATAYAEWLSKETGKSYRLPTEAEWEYACRASGNDRYCGGNDLDALGWHYGNSDNKTHPVGGKRANAWGLHDMSGNVWEWTCSPYDKDYGGGEQRCAGKNDATDGRGLRGGSWGYYTGDGRAANRYFNTPGYRSGSNGFRLARTLSP